MKTAKVIIGMANDARNDFVTAVLINDREIVKTVSMQVRRPYNQAKTFFDLVANMISEYCEQGHELSGGTEIIIPKEYKERTSQCLSMFLLKNCKQSKSTIIRRAAVIAKQTAERIAKGM